MLHRLGHLVARNVPRTPTCRLVTKRALLLPGVTSRLSLGPALSISMGRSYIATATCTKTTTATATATATATETTPAPLQYRTLAFYKFHDLSKVDLAQFRQQLLGDLGQMDIVGRIYIANEGINAQLSCPEWRIQELRTYCNHVLKPKLGGQLMDLNFGTEDSAGPAAFRALHVRIRKQVKCVVLHLESWEWLQVNTQQLVADGLDPKSYDLTNQPSHLSPAAWHEKLSKYKEKHGKDPILIDMRNHYERQVKNGTVMCSQYPNW